RGRHVDSSDTARGDLDRPTLRRGGESTRLTAGSFFDCSSRRKLGSALNETFQASAAVKPGLASHAPGRPREFAQPVHLGLGVGDLLVDSRPSGTALGVAGVDRTQSREHLTHLRREMFGDAGEVLIGQIPEFDVARLGQLHACARELVGHAKGHAGTHEPFGDVGGQRECARRSVSKSRVAIMPVNAGSSSSRVSVASKTGSLSSCRSRLYASGSAWRVESSPVRSPMRRPDLPRVSSAISGFFFCGMIDDPFEYASWRGKNENSFVAQAMTSSDRRERSMSIIVVMNWYSANTSRLAVPSIEFSTESLNPRSAATACGSSPRDEPARAPEPYAETPARASKSTNR